MFNPVTVFYLGLFFCVAVFILAITWYHIEELRSKAKTEAALAAAGLEQCYDAECGEVLWKRPVDSDTKKEC